MISSRAWGEVRASPQGIAFIPWIFFVKINRYWIALGLAVSMMTSRITPADANAEKNVPVNAILGVAVDMIDASGGPMKTAALLQWNGVKFSTWSEQVVITTNNRTSGVALALLSTAQLINGGSTAIPLTVKLGGNVLSAAPTTLSAAALFGGEGQMGAGNSLPMKLSIDAIPTVAPDFGSWRGMVQLSLAQAP